MEKKKKYRVSLGSKSWETYAVSKAKAINNVWWRYFKFCDPFTYTDVRIADFYAEEIDG